MTLRDDAVVVTGLGVVTPLGRDVASFWEALLSGRTAARQWDDLAAAEFRVDVACRIAGVPEGADRGRRLAVEAACAAVADAALPTSGRVGVYVGTTMGESAAFEQAAGGGAFDAPRAVASVFPAAVREALGVHGPARAYGTACAAGNYAIGAAAEAVAAGRVDAAVAGGVDPFSRIAMLGFSRIRAMAPDRCRPFDARRGGMQLGEGAAFVALETVCNARRRGAQVYCTIASLGLTCDAYHVTAPRPDGRGMADAMRHSLADAGVATSDVGWICAHGSGTAASDAAEARAIHAVFGAIAPPVSGLKGALGHSLGAATAIEAVATALALSRQVLPPTANFEAPHPEDALDVVRNARAAPSLRWALNCGYAFGGLNSALLMGSA